MSDLGLTRENMFKAGFYAALNDIKETGAVGPQWLTVLPDGELARLRVPGDVLSTEPAKDLMVQWTAGRMRELGVVLYAWVVEAWISESVDVRDGDLQAALDRHWEHYRRTGMSPARAHGRDEAVVIVVGDKDGSETRLWRIKRDEAGRAFDLVAREEHPGMNFLGRFADLLVEKRSIN